MSNETIAIDLTDLWSRKLVPMKQLNRMEKLVAMIEKGEAEGCGMPHMKDWLVRTVKEFLGRISDD